ncbi:MAG TPA: M4 family metallopeptidase, partial [Adhaeribacter sp.]|nr:M4 family metallopeptidase [Adhaeribacter sp.]
MNKTSTLLAGLLFACFGAFGQGFPQNSAAYKQADKVILDPQTNALQYLRFKSGVGLSQAAFPAWLRETLQQPNSTEWRQIAVFADDLGFEHIRYQQHHFGVPVEGIEFIAHIRNGEVVSCNGEYKLLPQIAPAAGMNKQAAFQQGLQLTGAKRYMWQDPAEEQLLKQIKRDPNATYYPEPVLVMAPANGNFDTDDFVPAYKMDIYASEPMDRSNLYFNAVTGKLLFRESLLHDIDSTGTAVTKYSGTQQIKTKYSNGLYRLQTNEAGVDIHTRNNMRQTNYAAATEFTDADNFWDNRNAFKDEAATDAHWGAEVTFEYFMTKHNRNSFDNSGSPMWSFIHHGQSYNNAFWNGVCMTYGDGDGSFMSPLTALDIVGHEFAHGVTGNSAQLVYRNESGALNESFSDIFGVAIDFENNPANANFLIGEQIMMAGGALRNMQNPNQFNDPDTYQGKFWKPLNGPDYGGVHSNSGVQNFWFYLLVNGGQGINDIGSNYNVTGIGISKAERIAYRNLTAYLTRNSNYADAAAMAVISAEDLYGACSPEAAATADAWYAVGVGQPYRIAASFVADNEYYCTAPAIVKFTNRSHNANSFIWHFGEGQTSTAANPTHTYTAPGTYAVKLKALAATPICGVAADSVERTAYIVVTNGTATVAACQPAPTTTPQANLGIK